MKYTLGTKQHMTQVFDEDGRVRPATVLKVLPVTVTQVKTPEVDGYSALQVGFGEKKEKHVHRAQKSKGNFVGYKEIRTDAVTDYKVGDVISSDFEVGDTVHVVGTSKGKGFQGVVKRHGFAGGPRSHGQKHSEREPGSIGSTGPQRVFKGMRMAGRMGGDRVTVKNLKIVQINEDEGTVLILGAVPGRRGTLIEVRSTAKI